MIINSHYVYWPEQCKQCRNYIDCGKRDKFYKYIMSVLELQDSFEEVSTFTRTEVTCDRFELEYDVSGSKV